MVLVPALLIGSAGCDDDDIAYQPTRPTDGGVVDGGKDAGHDGSTPSVADAGGGLDASTNIDASLATSDAAADASADAF